MVLRLNNDRNFYRYCFAFAKIAYFDTMPPLLIRMVHFFVELKAIVSD